MALSVRLLIPAVFAVVATVVLAFLLTMAYGHLGEVSDLPEYYAAGKLIMEGKGSDIYNLTVLGEKENLLFPAMRGRTVGLYVPPPALVWLWPLALVPVSMANVIWLLVLMLAVILSFLTLARCFQLGYKFLLWLTAISFLSGPMYEALRIGQLAPIILLGLSLSLLSLRQERSIFSAFALSTLLLKPQELLPFVVYLAGARRYKTVIALFLIAIALSAVSFTILGPAGYINYFNLLGQSVENSQGMQPELNPTVRGQLLRIFPNQLAMVTLASALVCLAALALIFVYGRLLGRSKTWLESGLLCAMPLGLLTALHCHDYDLLLLIPSVVVLCKGDLSLRTPGWFAFVGMLALSPFLLPLYVTVHYDYLLPGGVINPLFCLLSIFTCMMLVMVPRCNRTD